MMKKFIIMVSFDFLAFEAAEKTYIAEIERLKKRVIQAIPKSVMESAQPGHPRNIKESGTLSKRGANCVFQLFEAHATPLAVAYLMRISHRSATHWIAKWKAQQGISVPRLRCSVAGSVHDSGERIPAR